LTPQSLSPRRGISRLCARICLRYLRQTCLKQFGIHLMFLVNPPYCPPALLHMLDGTLPGALASSPVLSFPRSAA
jgi:hypothetical protein